MDSSRSAQRAIIQFLLAEGEHVSRIYRRMKEVYGEQCLAPYTIFRWCQRYEAGRVNIKGLATPWSGERWSKLSKPSRFIQAGHKPGNHQEISSPSQSQLGSSAGQQTRQPSAFCIPDGHKPGNHQDLPSQTYHKFRGKSLRFPSPAGHVRATIKISSLVTN
ncbi:hypothetical protein AVEN_109675-1 [Araneus ventricosus]|uniref:Mos1 transposase HTH domain-containing protein n=1 Tax=Araneus ventricosus TaxID=182803 RepID=A0A4Y2V8Q1_ARAVE|nr:hypothetical protein AVEN_109675-1 [Araneus ventricosus]